MLKFFDIKELCGILQISEGTADAWIKCGLIPTPFVGANRLLWRRQTCRECGCEFIPKGCSIYCGDACRQTSTRKKSRELAREWHHRQKQRAKQPGFKCIQCGKQFSGPWRKLCSDECTREQKKQYNLEYKQKVRTRIREIRGPVQLTCKICGALFSVIDARGHHGVNFCSSECRYEGRRRYRESYAGPYYLKNRDYIKARASTPAARSRSNTLHKEWKIKNKDKVIELRRRRRAKIQAAYDLMRELKIKIDLPPIPTLPEAERRREHDKRRRLRKAIAYRSLKELELI